MYKSLFTSTAAWWSYVAVSLQRGEQPAPWRDQYRALKSYYLNNGLYEVLDKLLKAIADDDKKAALRPLRNPAFRVVEFYAAKLWPGTLPNALPLEAKSDSILPAIQQVWQWSNWNIEKQTCARWFATFGDMFIKVATKGDPVNRVFMQNIEPEFVTDFDADERGYLTYIRMDIPRTRRNAKGELEAYTHTEVWTKQDYRLWEHDKGPDEELEKLGTPTQAEPLASFGIDFVPVVWVPFRSIGDERGTGAFTLQLDKIDEINRQATRLHQILFRYNRALWALMANATDSTGRPLPAPRIGGQATPTSAGNLGQLEVDDDTLLGLPGMSDIKSLVAQINYADALAILNAQIAELEQDLPELAYFRLRDAGELSGRAVRLLLGDAVDRLIEARGNGEAGLLRAQAMALTMGVKAGLFEGIGTYEAGSFEHKFVERDPFPLSDHELAETTKTLTDAGVPVLAAARFAGFSEEQLADLEKELASEQERTATLARAYTTQAETNASRNGAVATNGAGGQVA